ncbi:MAG: hypothetical protein HZC55_04145 [Verrucomicrobia bacterium]|nr:hypothetical protein [Verrucomicrobiota bacterium]
MTPPLLQIDAVALEQWLKILFWLAGGLTAVVVAFSHLTGRGGRREIQQPLKVEASTLYATKEENDKEHAAMRREIEKLDTERRTSVAKIHDKIEENTKLTANIDGRVEQMNQSMHTLTTSITQFMRDQANRRE